VNLPTTSFLLVPLLFSCVSSKELADPTILVHSPAGTELGVSTEYGTVFLGRFARGGEIDVTARFGDGPSLESSVVEPLGAGLFTAETEIRLPAVPLAFHQPQNGAPVTVRGRSGGGTWSVSTSVRADPRVDGILLRPTGGLSGAEEQIGAGVFVGEELEDYRLLGLVSGRIELVDPGGAVAEYVTVVGPTDLWRIVAHRRDLQRKAHWVYRDDIL
jgi:hypothetical protein